MSGNTADALAGRALLLISAFDPHAVGNGSSIRARRWCDALSAAVREHGVGADGGHFDAVVVPVVHTAAASPYRRLDLPGPEETAAKARLLAEPRWREWMVRTSPLPVTSELAPPWMGRELLASLERRPDVVVAFKMAVAPLAIDLALECGIPLVVDVDDDEPALARDVGNPRADALERLLHGVAERASVLTLAAPAEADAVRRRVDTAATVTTAPNVVTVPPSPLPSQLAGERGRVLFVANFDYAPNRAAARWLLDEVMPHAVGVDRLDIVGAFGEQVHPGALGRVDDVAPFLDTASVVVCPLLHGGGTSIKVLEAMAHGRAVVTTSVGARGLEVVGGEHVVVADDPDQFAAALSSLLADPDAAVAMGARARRLVETRYSSAVGAAAMVSAVATALGAPR